MLLAIALQNTAQVPVKSKKPVSHKMVKGKPKQVILKDSLYVLQVGDTLFSSKKADSYQWYNCVVNGGEIPGATSQWFLPVVSGTYSVQVKVKGKSRKSNCKAITISTQNIEQIPGFKIYPNPSSGIFMVTVSDEMVGTDYDVFNSMGEVVMHDKMTRQFRVNLLSYPNADYYLSFAKHKVKLVKYAQFK